MNSASQAERPSPAAAVFSTGSCELDHVIETLQAGDNVVYYTAGLAQYLPFVEALARRARVHPGSLVYVRSAGTLDPVMAAQDARVIDLAVVAAEGDVLVGLQMRMAELGPRLIYVFESLSTLAPWLGEDVAVERAFLAWCPLLSRLETVAYWSLHRGDLTAAAIAAIKDCTQIFLNVEALDDDLLLTPLKVWGRYSEAMFRPHRVAVSPAAIQVQPEPADSGGQDAYTAALADKNRELTEIRDALNLRNQELQQRNAELAELNERMSEQSRLYQSLRVNLDQLLTLFEAGQDISSSLVIDQVRRAIVQATVRLFEVSACRLVLLSDDGREVGTVVEGIIPAWARGQGIEALQALRVEACRLLMAQSLPAEDGEVVSVAVAPLTVRGRCLGVVELYADDGRLDSSEARTLLSYLSSEASIALDNAYLYRETEIQGEQLHNYLETVIVKEEQESRQLAFDLHDGLVQAIVAAYQHLQTAQVWRDRDPGIEEQEIDQCIRLLRESIYEARRLIGQLRPAGLDDFGLVHALRLYLAPLSTTEDWQVSLKVDPNWGTLPPALEAAVFRMVQEAVTNARKYSDVRRLEIELRALPDELAISVRDWGPGFDPSAVTAIPEQGLHMGLIGIRERARLWGGPVSHRQPPGRGDPDHRAHSAHPWHGARGGQVVIRIVLVDDQAIVREGLRSMLSPEPDLVVVGEAENGQEALDLVPGLDPDIVLMDVRMPEMDGLTALGRLKVVAPRSSVIMVTLYDDPDYLLRAVAIGAAGYILKDSSRDELVRAVRVTAEGGAIIAPSLLPDLLSRMSQVQAQPIAAPACDLTERLSEREMQVLRLIAEGHTNQEIAEELTIGATTVKTHVQNILQKLGVSDRTQAAVYAVRCGLI